MPSLLAAVVTAVEWNCDIDVYYVDVGVKLNFIQYNWNPYIEPYCIYAILQHEFPLNAYIWRSVRVVPIPILN